VPASDPLPSLVPEFTQRVGAGAPELLVPLMTMHADCTFVVRAFGAFDDY
jgi:hypothetical protein